MEGASREGKRMAFTMIMPLPLFDSFFHITYLLGLLYGVFKLIRLASP